MYDFRKKIETIFNLKGWTEIYLAVLFVSSVIQDGQVALDSVPPPLRSGLLSYLGHSTPENADITIMFVLTFVCKKSSLAQHNSAGDVSKLLVDVVEFI